MSRWLAFRRSGGLEWRALYRCLVLRTPEERAQGLLGTSRLHQGSCALLEFDAPGRQIIHTRGMRYPIDIVALDVDGYVIGSASDAVPDESEMFQSPDATVYIVELAAGQVELRKLGHGLRAEFFEV